jgi:hypothetical protein
MTSTAGIAQAWTSTRADQRQQATEIVALRQEAAAGQAARPLAESARPPLGPPAPEGQGRVVDKRV